MIMEDNDFFEAVLDILKENGFKNTTFDKIAQKTGRGRSTLFTKFKNKENLIYSAIYERTVSAKDLVFSEEITYNHLEKDLEILIGEYLRLYILQMPVYRLFMLPALNNKELNLRIYRKLHTLFDHLSEYLSEMQQREIVALLPFDNLSEVLFSTILEKSLFITGEKIEPDDPQVAVIVKELSNQFAQLITI